VCRIYLAESIGRRWGECVFADRGGEKRCYTVEKTWRIRDSSPEPLQPRTYPYRTKQTLLYCIQNENIITMRLSLAVLLVNCTDCGNFTTAFVNLIGGELYSSKMYTLGAGFDTNPYTAIGQPAWTPPSWGWGFSYHEVGWTGACGDGDSIFDPCLKVDGNGDPSAAPRTELLPTGMVFSDGNQGAPYVYRESLAAPGANGYGRCVAQPTSKQRRPIK